MLLPKFPPEFRDWKPSAPPSPPLPTWLGHKLGLNPWLTPEQSRQLEAETSQWASARAQAMVGPAYGFETARRAAHYMLGSYISRLPELPAIAAAAPPKVRKPRKPAIAEELEKALLSSITPEIEEELIASTMEAIKIGIKKVDLAKAVVDWAEEKGVGIKEAKGEEIVTKAFARLKR